MAYLLIAIIVVMLVLIVKGDMEQKKREEAFEERMRAARAEADRRIFEQSLARVRNKPRLVRNDATSDSGNNNASDQ